jgi:hypothetical protein
VFTIGKAPDLDLPSAKFSFAQDAQALIIERIPSPEFVFGA